MTRRCCLASGFPPHHHAVGCSRTPVPKPCTDNSPPWFVGHWREWHRGHGCDRDDGKPRAETATTEIAQHTANADTGFLTDAELNHLRASTTSGNHAYPVRPQEGVAMKRMPDGRLILDERCACGHLRSEHALPGCGVRATSSNHLECPCRRYTWKAFVFADQQEGH